MNEQQKRIINRLLSYTSFIALLILFALLMLAVVKKANADTLLSMEGSYGKESEASTKIKKANNQGTQDCSANIQYLPNKTNTNKSKQRRENN